MHTCAHACDVRRTKFEVHACAPVMQTCPQEAGQQGAEFNSVWATQQDSASK